MAEKVVKDIRRVSPRELAVRFTDAERYFVCRKSQFIACSRPTT